VHGLDLGVFVVGFSLGLGGKGSLALALVLGLKSFVT